MKQNIIKNMIQLYKSAPCVMVGYKFPYLSPLLVIVVWWLPLKALLPHLEFYYLLTVEVVFKAVLFFFAVLLFSVLIRFSFPVYNIDSCLQFSFFPLGLKLILYSHPLSPPQPRSIVLLKDSKCCLYPHCCTI